MRTVPQAAIDVIEDPKTVGARATFRKTLPVFYTTAISDSLGLTDPAWIDACNWNTGILRVTAVGNVLYTQYIADVHGVWPAWTNTTITLYPASRPAVDGGCVWYQKPNGDACYRNFAVWSSEVVVRNMPGALALAPLGNRCYALWKRYTSTYWWEIVSLNGTDSCQYPIYGLTAMPRVDVVSFNGKEYFYTTDRDEGRIVEIQHSGNAVGGKDSFGVGKAIIPIDAIDELHGLKLGYTSVID